MLAIVQNKQDLLTRQARHQCINERHAGGWAHIERGRHCSGHQCRILNRCQLDSPHAVREPTVDLLHYLSGKPCLANPARPGHGHQPMPGQEPGYLFNGS